MRESLTFELADWIRQVRFSSLPPEVVDLTKVTVLDWLGSAIAGSQTPPSAIVRRFAADQGGIPQATVIGGGQPARVTGKERQRTSALLTTFVNGVSSHIVELDDVHKGAIIHAGTAVIPAAIALAEQVAASGPRLIEAVVAGFEVCIRIGEAVTPSHYRYFHTTGTVGTFGAAAAASKLLDLSVEQTVHALGNAGTQAAGLWEFIEDGAMSKHLHSGKAGMNGLLAACLAKDGFTGASRILEGDRGFLRAMAQEYDAGKIVGGLGMGYKIMENCFKIHSSCRHTHHAVDLVIELVNRNNLVPENIGGIEVNTYQVALDITDNPNPESVYAAKFSLQFCAALAAVKRRASLRDFTEDTLKDSTVRGLLKKVRVAVDPVCQSRYPEKWGARVVIRTRGGAEYTASTEYPKGDFENPVSTEELMNKFRDLVDGCISAEEAERLIGRTMALDRLPDVRALFAE
ncbi:MmgE/PrpD family protein [Kyrpidia tusciae]|uniref:MmgE/PrpD family protein n=1 Tax=Kyrpidia tusciae (strain DSM 2912 / NBRC 15312 / T2) TaxID=562970 RepID=D5WXT3_KYRT2|nr:MmgE/PrpD family protein [Kyrpidia tusciae]ADG05992.1 MmgE/PrpD family protein [Kyrpidia tusciae DSM 2912]